MVPAETSTVYDYPGYSGGVKPNISAMPVAAAAVAAERRRQQELEEEEEERMTRYDSQEVEGGWEFKIIRGLGAFDDRKNMERILEEESRAGWTLLEKFDGARIRLKRPTSARSADASLDFDPYRTEVHLFSPSRAHQVVPIVALAVMVVAGIVAGLIAISMSGR